MSSTITNWDAVLPQSLDSSMTFKLPLASPPMDRLTTVLPPQQGTSFLGQAGTTLRFRIPAISKFLDTSKGVRFGFNLSLGDQAHMWLSEGAGAVISRLNILSSNEQLLESLGSYNLISRIHANATIPLSQKQTVLGVSAGFQPLTGSAPYAGRGNGHYEVVLHSGILSNAVNLPLRVMNGLIIDIVLAPAREALITDGASPSYQLTSAYLAYDTIEPHDAQKEAIDNAVRNSGGICLSFKSYRALQPAYYDANGTVVISDRHASIANVILAWRNNNTLNDVTQDAMQLAKPVDSIQTRVGGEFIEAQPLVFNATDTVRAFGEVMKYYHGNLVGEGMTASRFADYLGAKTGTAPTGYGAPTGAGSFFYIRDLETSSLVSGSPAAKKSNTDVEFVTTGYSNPGTFSCTAFVTYNCAVSFNLDSSVDLLA